ncbi:aminoglycoside phosphotransferase family protein [Metabacillus niabensis]|uniref:aminoglycoside phosphotransferase family protein n=1 Tax=Metabacillus niabensis TaxID=324854 RepID=UPI001CFBAECD|nr:aminoglycoside phosphotransferase family protein [Metabacillus niabensis]
MKIGQLLGVGNTASVYEWGKSEVIKIFHDFKSAMYEVTKEAQNAKIINKLNVRAPRFSKIMEYEGKTCLIYEKVEGPTMLNYIEPTRFSVSYNAKLLAQIHFEIHQVKIDVNSNLKTELSKSITNTEVITESERKIVLRILETLPEGKVLCHYDFHPGNIILSPNGPIIIDWLNTLVGHQLADVTRTYMMINSNALPPNAPSWLTERKYRDLFGKEYLDEYSNLSGIDRIPLDEWLVPIFASRIRELKGKDQLEIINNLKSAIKEQ